MDEEDVVTDVPSYNELALVRGDEVGDDIFKPEGNNLGKYFIGGVAEEYGEKILNRGGIGIFGYESKEGGVGGPTHFPFGHPRDKPYHVFFNYSPTQPVKAYWEAI